jgi:hypothetical protein
VLTEAARFFSCLANKQTPHKFLRRSSIFFVAASPTQRSVRTVLVFLRNFVQQKNFPTFKSFLSCRSLILVFSRLAHRNSSQALIFDRSISPYNTPPRRFQHTRRPVQAFRRPRTNRDHVIGSLCYIHSGAAQICQYRHREGCWNISSRIASEPHDQILLQEELDPCQCIGCQHYPHLRCPGRQGCRSCVLEGAGKPRVLGLVSRTHT